ncbi:MULTISPECIES: phosphatase PAP2 family protein [Roseivirga]|uniref:phosphatase PAP2 family protein n=1 Tax=Roseivirga TaxID=290180 RepID=UPI0012FE200D|nr:MULTISPECIES: phosphatase PAP2 family protein [Roseivirga]MBO6495093.1 phosphatase PAP2 family protein [Roseivirga sp.]MBO6662266.1 phosphatase PAP2 family protein [Roseivirga sp.]MBO6761684.1 phosphatase PAP2 family protein [Roseivirga sp.]WPZ08885.1 phosphatase PAP2 family protein [Roseivirga spongicola]
MNLAARLITYIFQPLLMPTAVFWVVLFFIEGSSNLTDKGKSTVVGLVFVTTFVIPALTVIMFKVTKVIKDLHMKDRRERLMPFMFISIFYLIVSFMIEGQQWMTPLLKVTFVAITTVVVVTNGITFRWKISAHTAGVFGSLGFILALQRAFPSTNYLLWPLLVAIALCGAVSWARLYLHAHTPKEVLGGALLGFVVCYGSILLFA